MFKEGDIVSSKAGHDTGRIYVVLRLDGEFVYLADGDYRGIDKQKRKRIKHLKFAYDKRLTEEAIKEGINVELGENPTDADIKRIIKQWRAYAERR